MRVREFEAYRASYCGLCKELGHRYGTLSRFLLNYDLVLVALLADALSGETGYTSCEGCFANPLLKKNTLHNTQGLSLAGDGLVLLSWHQLRDNLADEKPLKRFGYLVVRPFMRAMYQKAARKRPALSALIEEQMARQSALEAAGCTCIDEACEPTAKMCAAIFREASADSSAQPALERMGLFCGQIVYLLDAAEDFEEDTAAGAYNVFVRLALTKQQAVETTRRRCKMAAGEIALCYNLLTLRQHREILDNILFLGLPRGIGLAGQKRTKGVPHGQIESL